MLLSRPDIIKEIESERLRFSPKVELGRIDQVSIDLLLGNQFTRFKEAPGYITSVQLDPSIWESGDIWQEETVDTFILRPGKFVLAQTLETVTFPDDLAGLIEGRSGFARLGISVHLTAPKIDPGFSGTIILEMANHGNLPITLRAGIDKPAQLLFLRISEKIEKGKLYGSGKGDVFQYQDKPIPRKN